MTESDSVGAPMPSAATSASASDKPIPSWSDEYKAAMTARKSHDETHEQLKSMLSLEPKPKLPGWFWDDVGSSMRRFEILNAEEESYLFPTKNGEFGTRYDVLMPERQQWFDASKEYLAKAADQLKAMNDALASEQEQGSATKGGSKGRQRLRSWVTGARKGGSRKLASMCT